MPYVPPHLRNSPPSATEFHFPTSPRRVCDFFKEVGYCKYGKHCKNGTHSVEPDESDDRIPVYVFPHDGSEPEMQHITSHFVKDQCYLGFLCDHVKVYGVKMGRSRSSDLNPYAVSLLKRTVFGKDYPVEWNHDLFLVSDDNNTVDIPPLKELVDDYLSQLQKGTLALSTGKTFAIPSIMPTYYKRIGMYADPDGYMHDVGGVISKAKTSVNPLWRSWGGHIFICGCEEDCQKLREKYESLFVTEDDFNAITSPKQDCIEVSTLRETAPFISFFHTRDYYIHISESCNKTVTLNSKRTRRIPCLLKLEGSDDDPLKVTVDAFPESRFYGHVLQEVKNRFGVNSVQEHSLITHNGFSFSKSSAQNIAKSWMQWHDPVELCIQRDVKFAIKGAVGEVTVNFKVRCPYFQQLYTKLQSGGHVDRLKETRFCSSYSAYDIWIFFLDALFTCDASVYELIYADGISVTFTEWIALRMLFFLLILPETGILGYHWLIEKIASSEEMEKQIIAPHMDSATCCHDEFFESDALLSYMLQDEELGFQLLGCETEEDRTLLRMRILPRHEESLSISHTASNWKHALNTYKQVRWNVLIQVFHKCISSNLSVLSVSARALTYSQSTRQNFSSKDAYHQLKKSALRAFFFHSRNELPDISTLLALEEQFPSLSKKDISAVYAFRLPRGYANRKQLVQIAPFTFSMDAIKNMSAGNAQSLTCTSARLRTITSAMRPQIKSEGIILKHDLFPLHENYASVSLYSLHQPQLSGKQRNTAMGSIIETVYNLLNQSILFEDALDARDMIEPMCKYLSVWIIHLLGGYLHSCDPSSVRHLHEIVCQLRVSLHHTSSKFEWIGSRGTNIKDTLARIVEEKMSSQFFEGNQEYRVFDLFNKHYDFSPWKDDIWIATDGEMTWSRKKQKREFDGFLLRIGKDSTSIYVFEGKKGAQNLELADKQLSDSLAALGFPTASSEADKLTVKFHQYEEEEEASDEEEEVEVTSYACVCMEACVRFGDTMETEQ